jgi:DNA-binding transcriptional MerR regulator
MNSRSYSISDLAKEFAISSRTIRYYEEKRLINPQRSKGNHRRYSPRDRFRLKWILRGKRFGYDLDEISRILAMTDTQIDVAQQIQTTLDYGEVKMKEIEDRIQELVIMKKEMLSLKEKLLQRLAELKPGYDTKPS